MCKLGALLFKYQYFIFPPIQHVLYATWIIICWFISLCVIKGSVSCRSSIVHLLSLCYKREFVYLYSIVHILSLYLKRELVIAILNCSSSLYILEKGACQTYTQLFIFSLCVREGSFSYLYSIDSTLSLCYGGELVIPILNCSYSFFVLEKGPCYTYTKLLIFSLCVMEGSLSYLYSIVHILSLC
jgi:hypothetical protein